MFLWYCLRFVAQFEVSGWHQKIDNRSRICVDGFLISLIRCLVSPFAASTGFSLLLFRYARCRSKKTHALVVCARMILIGRRHNSPLLL